MDVKIIVLDGEPNQYMDLAMHLLTKASNDPKKKAIIDNLLSDTRLDRNDVFYAGFTLGVIEIMSSVQAGNLHECNKG